MATKEDMQTVLMHEPGWYYHPAAPMAKKRRALFRAGDMFYFLKHPKENEKLRLKVVDTDNILVLGSELELVWDDKKTAFFVEAYGREMRFIATGSDSAGWTMVYSGMFLSAPHHGPDEGGDGDPR